MKVHLAVSAYCVVHTAYFSLISIKIGIFGQHRVSSIEYPASSKTYFFSGVTAGTATVNVVPFPTSLLMLMRPPIFAMIS